MIVKAVLFDLGNTLAVYTGNQTDDLFAGHQAFIKQLSVIALISNMGVWEEKFHRFINGKFQERNITFVETPLYELILEFISIHFSLKTNKKQIDQLISSYFSATEPNWIKTKNLYSILNQIRSKDIRMGILSNACSDQNVQNIVDNLQIRSYFDFVISSCSLRVRKPANAAFLKSINNWKFDPSEILMVGDMLSQDIQGATQMDMPSAWISYGQKNQDNKIKPTIIINQLSELVSYL